MKTITEHIREHLLRSIGYSKPDRKPDFESLRKSEWSVLFEKYQRNRLIMGALRYGLINHGGKSQYNRVDSIRQRLDLYEQTGNQEHLVDISNLCMLEFEEPAHKNAHWKATDEHDYHVEVKE